MNTSLTEFLFAGVALALVQGLAAIPWLVALDPFGFRDNRGEEGSFASKALGNPQVWGYFAAGVLGLGVFLAYLMNSYRSDESLGRIGRWYGAALHIQLQVDLLILFFFVILRVWRKGGAVALAAFRESIRQPTFWLITLMATFLITLSLVVPYFTFGEDYKMMKQLGFDSVMLAGLLFGLLTVSISIHDEIEGRTAITVMSKPINRRQFLIGKYVGVIAACWAMTALLGWILTWALYLQPIVNANSMDEINDVIVKDVVRTTTPAFGNAMFTPEGKALARGAGTWFGETIAHHAGLLLTFGQIMVLVAICAALATRLPFVINLVICGVIFLFGHLSPVLVEVTSKMGENAGTLKLVSFLASLFNVVFPALDYFQMGTAIIRENPLQFQPFVIYVCTVLGYAVLYAAIALIVGLLLFEDKDLA